MHNELLSVKSGASFCAVLLALLVASCGGIAVSDDQPPTEEGPAENASGTDRGFAAGGGGGIGGALQAEESFRGPPAVSWGHYNQSCEGLGDICNGESCCADIEVPGGIRTWDGRQRKVSEFQLDKYEVTVARWRNFVDNYPGPPPAGAGAHPHAAGSGWQSAWDEFLPEVGQPFEKRDACVTKLDEDFEEQSTTAAGCLSLYEAFAFCAWDGRRLPSLAEWQYAAGGGDENLLTPWGQDPWIFEDAACEYADTYGCPYPWESFVGIVGQYPKGAARWGHMDMVGNVWLEWVRDAVRADPFEPQPSFVINPVRLSGNLGLLAQSPASIIEEDPNFRNLRIGVRCAGPTENGLKR